MALTQVTVTGTFHSAGVPAAGSVSFTPSAVLQDAAGDVIHAAVTTTATLDAGGSFTITLRATDDPGVQPTGVTYRVVERITGTRLRTYSIALPAADLIVDLADVVPTELTAVTYNASAGY